MIADSTDERTRAADLFERFSRSVAARLQSRYSGVDEQCVADAVVDAILLVAKSDGPIDAMITHILARKSRDRLRVRLRGERRRIAREAIAADRVTKARAAAGSIAEAVAARELAARFRGELAQKPDDLAVLDLWCQGITEPAELAAALGWTATLTPDDDEDVTDDDDVSVRKVRTILAKLRQRVHRLRQELTAEETPHDQSQD